MSQLLLASAERPFPKVVKQMKRYGRRAALACAAALLVAVTPRTASAQEEKWQVDLAPLYLWL